MASTVRRVYEVRRAILVAPEFPDLPDRKERPARKAARVTLASLVSLERWDLEGIPGRKDLRV